MKAELHIKSGLSKGGPFGLGRLGSHTIGRRSENDVHLPDKSVSRKHCRIDFDGEHHWIIDCESHNGTFVNQRKVSRCMLYSGDVIRVGKIQLEFLVEEPANDDDEW